jgi:hypothetical protein
MCPSVSLSANTDLLKKIEYNVMFMKVCYSQAMGLWPTHEIEAESMLQPAVSWLTCLGVGRPSGANGQICITVVQLQVS